MNQQFILGLMAGTFISIEIYLIYHIVKDFFQIKSQSNLDKPSNIISILLTLLSIGIFTFVYFQLININPPENIDPVKNLFIYKEFKTGKNIIITLIFLFEIAFIAYLSSLIKMNKGTNYSFLPRSLMFFTLTCLFLGYDIFLFFSDFKDPSEYSGIALGGVSIFIAILIALLTFKDDKNSTNESDL